LRVAITFKEEYQYYMYLIETFNVRVKYMSPDKVLRGREMELLCLMAVGSDKSHTLEGTAFRDWLVEEGGFTYNDIYRYTSKLQKKGWLTQSLIRITPTGQSVPAKEGDIGALEGYSFRIPFFDKKRFPELSVELILNASVDIDHIKRENQIGGGDRESSTVPDSTSRVIHSSV
jgi:hypothetical protein